MKTVTAKDIQTDLLLESEIINENAYNTRTGPSGEAFADRLHALGFTQAQGADYKAKKQEAEHLGALVVKYEAEYPGLKFIHSEAMDRVCKKYKLTIGKPSNYTGDIPEWALKTIENNKHLIRTWEEPIRRFAVWGTGGVDWMQQAMMDRQQSFEQRMMEMWLPVRAQPIISNAARWAMDEAPLIKPEIKETPKPKAPTRTLNNLMIVAPNRHMKAGVNEQKKGRRLVEVQDPIVCLDVEGGYIVLAAWGEEGSDPAILNPLNN